MVSSAQLEPEPELDGGARADALPEPFALNQQIAERVAEHRARRGYSAAHSPSAAGNGSSARNIRSRHAHVAGAVAERYARAESYRSFLASEAERSVRHAEAVVEVATINARAIANAQQQLLADLDHWELPVDHADAQTGVALDLAGSGHQAPRIAFADSTPLPTENMARHYTVRHAEDLPHPLASTRDTTTAARREVPDEIDLDEYSALDEEIAFRHAAAPDEAVPESLPLAANLIEFPRQLIATRKARPRLAEGPLREEAAAAESQLRIFEVEAAAIADTVDLGLEGDAAPEWSSILLAPQPEAEYLPGDVPAFAPAMVPQVAPISHRLMAALVDAVLVLATSIAADALFVTTAAHVNPAHGSLHLKPPIAALAVAASALVLGVVYLLLFFTFSESTPGMRYARIALCTFADENPSRSAIRRRLLSMALGALPFGVGLLWAFVDEDTLAWHDRLSRMYQRSY